MTYKCNDKKTACCRDKETCQHWSEEARLANGESVRLARGESVSLARGEGLRLHPHHCICILNYEGKGYSEEFNENMGRIVKSLASDTVIKLSCTPDCVCSACKNRVEGSGKDRIGCSFAEKVSRYDSALLKVIGFSEGDEVEWGELRKRVMTTVMNKKSSLANICGDCEWFGICSKKCGRL